MIGTCPPLGKVYYACIKTDPPRPDYFSPLSPVDQEPPSPQTSPRVAQRLCSTTHGNECLRPLPLSPQPCASMSWPTTAPADRHLSGRHSPLLPQRETGKRYPHWRQDTASPSPK